VSTVADVADRFVEPDGDPAWRDPVLVVCPRCSGCAVIRAAGVHSARLVCGGCGLARDWHGDRLHVLIDGTGAVLTGGMHAWVDPATGRGVRDCATPEGIDPRFGARLWLWSECCGGKLLWANNEVHLDYLDAYVRARLRERPHGPAPLSARLPGWMKIAKNRDEVLRHIERLRRGLTAHEPDLTTRAMPE